MPRNTQPDQAKRHIKRRTRARVHNDPSGHGEQIVPRQQREVAEANDHAPNATGRGEDASEGTTFIDTEALEDLKE